MNKSYHEMPECTELKGHYFTVIRAIPQQKDQNTLLECTLLQCVYCKLYKLRVYNRNLDEEYFGSLANPVEVYYETFDADSLYGGEVFGHKKVTDTPEL